MGDDRDLKRRLAFFGHNTKPAPHLPSYWESLKEAIEDKILLVLAICAALSIIFGMVYSPKTGWVEGVSIYVVVVIMVMITSLNDYAKDVRFVELQAVARDTDLPVFRGKMGQM
jgi:magnesium-transporting ATPase (P-type)